VWGWGTWNGQLTKTGGDGMVDCCVLDIPRDTPPPTPPQQVLGFDLVGWI